MREFRARTGWALFDLDEIERRADWLGPASLEELAFLGLEGAAPAQPDPT